MVLVAAVALAHGGALRNGFVALDDVNYVTANPRVQAGLTLPSIAWAFAFEGRQSYFHPLTWLSLMLDAELFGGTARGSHLVNVLLHGANALLLFVLLWRATGRPRPAFAAALLWAVHPLTVEAVTWVAERKAVLSTAFGLAAMLLHVGHARRPSPWKVAGVAALVLLGALAKPAVAVVPVVLLALDLWPLDRVRESGWARLALEKLPALLVGGAVVAIGMASLRAAYAVEGAIRTPLADRLAVALAAVPRYLGAVAWPTGLAVLHPYPGAVPWGRAAAGATIVIAASALAVAAARRWPAGLACWGWFLAAIAPYLGLVQAGLWPEWAERFAYLPLAGLAALAAYGAADLAARVPRGGWVAAGALAAAAAALALATRAQVEVWRDTGTLLTRAVAIEPRSAFLRTALGSWLLETGRAPEAEAQLRAAVALEREPLAHAALATLLMRQGRHAEAEPHFATAVRALPNQPELVFNYAEHLRATGRAGEARAFYARFARIAPERYESQRRAALRHAVGGGESR